MKNLLLIILLSAFCAAITSLAQNSNARLEDPAHQELRALRDGLLAAMNKGDLEAALAFLHTNCVITWHNAETSRGHAGVREHVNRAITGPKKLVESFHCDVKVDEPTMLPGGDAGICDGSSDEQFKLTSGKDLHVEGRWSATLVKADGRWLVASLHESTNLYDNVLLDLARKVAWSVAMVSLVLGLIIGFIAGRKSK